MMSHAIINDCLQAQCDISVMLDHRIQPDDRLQQHSSLHYFITHNAAQYQSHWQHCLDTCDAIIIIAPEAKQCLTTLHQQASQYPILRWGSSLETLRITSDKQRCHHILQPYQLSVPNSVFATDWPEQYFHSINGFIIKPIDGAGCLNTFFCSNHDEVNITLLDHPHSVIQPFIPGHNLSLSLLYTEQQVCVLSINQQHISTHNRQLKLDACTVNPSSSHDFSVEQAYALARRLHQALPGLWGFIGIDIIVNKDMVYIIDINPRPTTSYCGLHPSLQTNPMTLLLDTLSQKPLPQHVLQRATPVTISL